MQVIRRADLVFKRHVDSVVTGTLVRSCLRSYMPGLFPDRILRHRMRLTPFLMTKASQSLWDPSGTSGRTIRTLRSMHPNRTR